MWLFAHRLSKPFLYSCFAVAYLSSPSPFVWHSFKGIPVGRAVGDSLNDTCIPVLNVLCWLILQEFTVAQWQAQQYVCPAFFIVYIQQQFIPSEP